MKEKNTNKADRAFLDVYPGETHPQEAESSERVAHAESALTPKRISTKMRRGTRDAGGLQADLPRPRQADRTSGSLFESGDSGACRLRCPSIGRQGRQSVELRGAYCARPFGRLRRGDRGVAKAVIQVHRFIKEFTNDKHVKQSTTA